MIRRLLLALCLGSGAAQHPGKGIAKTTWACNDPAPGFAFMRKYFPDKPGPAECENNVCECTTDGTNWEIQQGRVNLLLGSTLDEDGPPGGPQGFGMHLVNVSAHLTTGGMTVAAVEAEFAAKLGTMDRFDSFMDHNVAFTTADLDGYVKAFDADAVPYLSYAAPDGHGVFVHVPASALIIELLAANASAVLARRGVDHVFLEPRAATGARALAAGATLALSSVNRAVSAATYDALDAFYVDGLGTTLSGKWEADGVKRKCFRWPEAQDDVCFASRPDANTSTPFKTGDFENMLHAVHEKLLVNPLCAMDKWTDVHYAVDSHGAAANTKIVPYLEKTKTKHFCFSTTQLHYLVDPTGMSIQLDIDVDDAAAVCGSSSSARRLQPGPGPHENPACNPGTCTP